MIHKLPMSVHFSARKLHLYVNLHSMLNVQWKKKNDNDDHICKNRLISLIYER